MEKLVWLHFNCNLHVVFLGCIAKRAGFFHQLVINFGVRLSFLKRHERGHNHNI